MTKIQTDTGHARAFGKCPEDRRIFSSLRKERGHQEVSSGDGLEIEEGCLWEEARRRREMGFQGNCGSWQGHILGHECMKRKENLTETDLGARLLTSFIWVNGL